MTCALKKITSALFIKIASPQAAFISLEKSSPPRPVKEAQVLKDRTRRKAHLSLTVRTCDLSNCCPTNYHLSHHHSPKIEMTQRQSRTNSDANLINCRVWKFKRQLGRFDVEGEDDEVWRLDQVWPFRDDRILSRAETLDAVPRANKNLQQ